MHPFSAPIPVLDRTAFLAAEDVARNQRKADRRAFIKSMQDKVTDAEATYHVMQGASDNDICDAKTFADQIADLALKMAQRFMKDPLLRTRKVDEKALAQDLITGLIESGFDRHMHPAAQALVTAQAELHLEEIA